MSEIQFCQNCGGRLDWPADPMCLYKERHSIRDQVQKVEPLLTDKPMVVPEYIKRIFK